MINMGYITKKEVKNNLEIELNNLLSFIGYKFKKGKNTFIKYTNNGFGMLVFAVTDDFNLSKNEVCWKIDANFFVRFDIIHQWFEPFDIRDKKDLKNVWSKGESINTNFKSNLSIDVDDVDAKNKIKKIALIIVKEFTNFINENNTLEKLEKAILPKQISELEDISDYKYFNVNYAIVILSLAKILKRSDFENIINISRDKINQLVKVGDPMAKVYINKFEDIIYKLQSNEFNDFKHSI